MRKAAKENISFAAGRVRRQGETLGAVNRMCRGCFSAEPDGVAGSPLDVRQERANTNTEKHHIGLVDAQASITLSATSLALAN